MSEGLFLIEVYFPYDVMLVSGMQRSDSTVLYIV